jgi:Holliday junction resolvase RusA-like endonuclease
MKFKITGKPRMTFLITGKPISSKNSRPVFVNSATGKRFVGKSARLIEYTDSALWQLKAQKAKNGSRSPLTEDLHIRFIFYVPDKRKRDLTNLEQLPSDLLEMAEIIKDDCQIKSKDGSRILIDKKNPRTEIEIELYRTCFNCAHFSQTVDDYQCWATGEPVSTHIMEDCSGWEEE